MKIGRRHTATAPADFYQKQRLADNTWPGAETFRCGDGVRGRLCFAAHHIFFNPKFDDMDINRYNRNRARLLAVLEFAGMALALGLWFWAISVAWYIIFGS